MNTAHRPLRRVLAALVAVTALTVGCSQTVSGTGSIGLDVVGISNSSFDTTATQTVGAVLSFWNATYPTIAHGQRLPPLKGELYSIDGTAVIRTKSAPKAARDEKCMQKRLDFIVDNAAYCELDDSIVWDRAANHLLPVLSRAYGPTVTALVFAHEFGHAIQHRLHLDTEPRPTIDLESQADCAAGAFAAAALQGRVPDFELTPAQLDRALEGYLQIRDATPETSEDISHGDGFDRLNALQQGIKQGAAYCYGSSFFADRDYTERGFVSDADREDNGNQPLDVVLDPTTAGLLTDLNRFWTSAAQGQGKKFAPVQVKQSDHPACGSVDPTSEFGYCPDDNTVYYSTGFAHDAYYSITAPSVNEQNGDITLDRHQPGDFALGTMFATAWGLAAQHQLHGRDGGTPAALLAAVCEAGAYAADINKPEGTVGHEFVLSPPDMDEATSAVLGLVGQPQAFGTRGTTGLQRVQSFVRGYTGGRVTC